MASRQAMSSGTNRAATPIVKAAIDANHAHDLEIEIAGRFTLTAHSFDLV